MQPSALHTAHPLLICSLARLPVLFFRHVNISVYGKVCHSMVGGSAYTQVCGQPGLQRPLRSRAGWMCVELTLRCSDCIFSSFQDVTVRRLLDCIYGLLLSPQIDDPLNSNLALLYYVRSDTQNRHIAEHSRFFPSSRCLFLCDSCPLVCLWCRRAMARTRLA